AGHGSLGSPPVDQLARQFVEEPARRIVLGGTPSRSGDGAGDVEPLARPGNADVSEPPLLCELVAGTLGDRSLMRENAVFTTGEEDRVELQALRRVQRHQGDDAGVSSVWSIGNLV